MRQGVRGPQRRHNQGANLPTDFAFPDQGGADRRLIAGPPLQICPHPAILRSIRRFGCVPSGSAHRSPCAMTTLHRANP